MSRNDPTGADPAACPYVGLADDPRTRFSFPVQGHRCHAKSKAAKIDLAWQGGYCLSSRYPTCDRYHPPAAGPTEAGGEGPNVAMFVAGEDEVRRASLLDPPSPPEPAVDRKPSPEYEPAAEPAMPPAPPGSSPDPPTPETENTSGMTGFRPVSPPPTPWRAATTSSVLAAILPPMGGPTPSTPSEREPPDVKPKASAPPASSWFAESTSAAVTLVPLPKTTPPAESSGAGPASTERDAPSDRRPQPSGGGRSRRRRALLLLGLLIVLAVAAIAVAVATGSFDRLRQAGPLAGAVVPPSATPLAGLTASRTPEASTAPSAVETSRAAGPTTTPDMPSTSPATNPAPSSSGAVGAVVIHVVKTGESLTSIAAQYGVTPQAIERANKLKDANLLRIGQKLIIPTAH